MTHIGTTLNKLNVFGDCLRTLDGVLKLILDFLNMPTRWMSICVRKGEPGIKGGGGLLNKGNQWSRDGATRAPKSNLSCQIQGRKSGSGVSWSAERVMADGQK